jgi:hypothetical protein
MHIYDGCDAVRFTDKEPSVWKSRLIRDGPRDAMDADALARELEAAELAECLQVCSNDSEP